MFLFGDARLLQLLHGYRVAPAEFLLRLGAEVQFVALVEQACGIGKAHARHHDSDVFDGAAHRVHIRVSGRCQEIAQLSDDNRQIRRVKLLRKSLNICVRRAS